MPRCAKLSPLSSLPKASLVGNQIEEADLEALVDATLERYGRIDGVVNSSGHPASGEILDLTDKQWHEALDLWWC